MPAASRLPVANLSAETFLYVNDIFIRRVHYMKETPEPRNSLRALGTVHALNDALSIGQVRLLDNRRVFFNYRNIDELSRPLSLRDDVMVEATLTDEGLVATSVKRKADEVKDSTDTGATPDMTVESIGAPQDSNDNNNVKRDVDRGQNTQEAYQLAAVARAEGRFSDARELFELALSHGIDENVYVAYAKMLIEAKGEGRAENVLRARQVLSEAMHAFPRAPTAYVMLGQLERRGGNLESAQKILRTGLKMMPYQALIRSSLAQVLAQIATPQSLREAGEIFDSLAAEGKLNHDDNSFTRFRALASNPRAGLAYSFFERISGFRPTIPAGKNLPSGVNDLILDVSDADLDASFGFSGAFIVRCFSEVPKRPEINALSTYLRSLKSDSTIGLATGREVILNTSVAFVAIPQTGPVRDYLMSVISEKNEAIIPIDDELMRKGASGRHLLRELLSQYLAARDLYDSTLPVSGRRLFGRERLLVRLVDDIHRGEFIGIFGLRKMGKTSLVYQLRDEKLKDDAIAYVDLQASPGLALRSFWPVCWEIERDLLSRLGVRHPTIVSMLRLGHYERYSDALRSERDIFLLFSEDVRTLLDSIKNGVLAGISRLVIVLDELERCLPLAGQRPMDGYIEFFGLLRGLAQTERYRGLISSVVVAANAAISERAYWEGRENPVFALYKTVFVPPLSAPDTEQMIQTLGKGMGVYWDPAAINMVIKECGGHPYLTRVLCSQISHHYPKRPLQVVRQLVVDEIPLFVRDKSDKFQQITELLHTHFPEEEKILECLALQAPLPAMSDESVRHLLGYQLIERRGDDYSIPLKALASWLQRRAGADHE